MPHEQQRQDGKSHETSAAQNHDVVRATGWQAGSTGLPDGPGGFAQHERAHDVTSGSRHVSGGHANDYDSAIPQRHKL